MTVSCICRVTVWHYYHSLFKLPVNQAGQKVWRQLVEKPAGSKEPDSQTVAITRMRKLASRGMATTSCLLLCI